MDKRWLVKNKKNYKFQSLLSQLSNHPQSHPSNYSLCKKKNKKKTELPNQVFSLLVCRIFILFLSQTHHTSSRAFSLHVGFLASLSEKQILLVHHHCLSCIFNQCIFFSTFEAFRSFRSFILLSRCIAIFNKAICTSKVKGLVKWERNRLHPFVSINLCFIMHTKWVEMMFFFFFFM